jgi:FkbM family methyltransferase
MKFVTITRYEKFCLKAFQSLNFLLLTHPFKGNGLIRKIIRQIFYPKITGPLLLTTRNNIALICLNPLNDKGVENFLYFYGTYEAGTLSIMKNCLRPNDTFLDVGANIGLMSLYASFLVGDKGKIYSFEPEPKIFSIFLQNISLNQRENIIPLNIALGESKGEGNLYLNPDFGCGSTSLIEPKYKSSQNCIKTQIESMDEVISIYKISGIKMVKIDTEGYEALILKGAEKLLKSSKAPVLCFEFSKHTAPFGDNYMKNMLNFISNINNYKIFKLINGKEIPSPLVEIRSYDDLPAHDNLYCFLPHHIKELSSELFLQSF